MQPAAHIDGCAVAAADLHAAFPAVPLLRLIVLPAGEQGFEPACRLQVLDIVIARQRQQRLACVQRPAALKDDGGIGQVACAQGRFEIRGSIEFRRFVRCAAEGCQVIICNAFRLIGFLRFFPAGFFVHRR